MSYVCMPLGTMATHPCCFLTIDVPIGGSLAAVKELETKLGLDLTNEPLETARAVSAKL